jgi:predicted  nucleic acid-binding Zn-ribbon protein
MNSIIRSLLALQELLQQHRPATDEQKAAAELLRQQIPTPILAHFDRMIAGGRNGVSLVRNGVCSGCHMRVPVGTAASLANPNDVHLCENCGSYLALAPEEPEEAAPPAPVQKPAAIRRTRKKLVAV